MIKKLFIIIVPAIILITVILWKSLFSSDNLSPVTRRVDKVVREYESLRETIAPIPTVITSNGIPDKHLINTQFVPQAPEKNWDQPWQDTCEEAAILTSYYYLTNQKADVAKIKADLLSMIDFEKSKTWEKDINHEKMSQVITEYLKFKSTIIEDPNIEDIRTSVSQNIPVIATADGRILFKENKNFRSGGPPYHALVILGYDDNTKKFTVHDVGTQHGAYFKYSYDLLMESLHDLPQSGDKHDIQSGKKSVILMLK